MRSGHQRQEEGPGNDAAVRQARQTTGKSGDGGGGEEDGRPPLGMWEKATAVQVEILKQITGGANNIVFR